MPKSVDRDASHAPKSQVDPLAGSFRLGRANSKAVDEPSQPGIQAEGSSFGLFLDSASLKALTEGLVKSKQRFSGIQSDLNAQVAAHAYELDQTRAHLRLVFDSIPDGLITCTQDGVVQSVNSAAGALFGAGFAAGSNLIEHLPELELGTINGNTREQWLINDCQQAARVEIEVSDLGPEGMRLVRIRDITAVTYTSRRLAEQSYLIEHVQALVMMGRTRSGIEWSNPYAQALFGLNSEQLVGKPLIDIADASESDPDSIDALSCALERGERFSLEVMVRHASGRLVWLQLEGHPVEDDSGTDSRYLLLGTDMTSHKRHEQMQNEFCSMVSHELRTPLTVVSGILEALDGISAQTPETAELDTLVAMGRRNCGQLAVLIDDILDINRLEAGAIRFASERFDLNTLLADCLESLDRVMVEADLRVELTVPDTACTVFADPQRMRQAINNVLSNAVKFSPAGSSLSVSLQREDDQYMIDVTDQGPGIPLTFQAHVFEKFARDVAVQASGIEGFGLGLSITRSLLQAMGADIEFFSDGQSGTRFRISTPASDSEDRQVMSASLL